MPSPARLPPAALALAMLLSGAIGACSIGAPPPFDPGAPCVADARLPGAYPALEALIPTTMDGRIPDRVDSGRNCSELNLSTLAERGFDEVRFAGGLWERGERTGTTLAVFEAAGLTPELLGEWFEAGARQTTDTTGLTMTRPTVGGAPAVRLDALVDEAWYQTVIVWPHPDPNRIRVVLVATEVRGATRAEHDAAVVAGLDAHRG